MIKTTLLLIGAFAASSINATIIFSGDFMSSKDASAITGTTGISGFTSPSSSSGLLTGGQADSSITVNLNLNTDLEASWSFGFTVEEGFTATIDENGVTTTVASLTGGGAYQTSNRFYDYVRVSFIDSSDTNLISYGLNDYFTQATAGGSPQAGTANTASLFGSSIILSAGDYTALFTALDLDSGGSFFSVEDFEINGTVTAVPEPSTFALLSGILTLGLVYIRRRLR